MLGSVQAAVPGRTALQASITNKINKTWHHNRRKCLSCQPGPQVMQYLEKGSRCKWRIAPKMKAKSDSPPTAASLSSLLIQMSLEALDKGNKGKCLMHIKIKSKHSHTEQSLKFMLNQFSPGHADLLCRTSCIESVIWKRYCEAQPWK